MAGEGVVDVQGSVDFGTDHSRPVAEIGFLEERVLYESVSN